MKTKQIIWIAAVSLLLSGIFIFLVLNSHQNDPKAFILTGSRFSKAEEQGTTGYDGQFAYYIALEPLSAYRHMDEPGKRYQRILLPMLAWIFSIGDKSLTVPWMLLEINLAAIIITIAILSIMLSERRASPWVALIYIFYIGTLFCLRADLNEPLAMALSLSGWFAYQRRHIAFAMLLFALAGLAKEIGLIFPLALAIWELLQRRYQRGLVFIGFCSIPYMVWFLLLRLRWGISTGSLIPTWLPFSGISALKDRSFFIVVGVWILIPAAVFIIFLIKDLIMKIPARWNLETCMLIVNLVFFSIMPYQTWKDPLAIFRSAMPLVIAACIWMAANQRQLLPYITALWASSCILLFITPGMVF